MEVGIGGIKLDEGIVDGGKEGFDNTYLCSRIGEIETLGLCNDEREFKIG